MVSDSSTPERIVTDPQSPIATSGTESRKVIMVLFFTLIALGALAAMVGTVVVTVRDGLRRLPTVAA